MKSQEIKEKKFQDELNTLEFWKKNKIYEKVKKMNNKNELFTHIDGPPYPTGDIHLGHLRNWTIKDSVLRFKRLQGYNVYARDGYDVHGLPVENKVQAKLNLKTVDDLKKFGEENFVKECKTYIQGIINDMSEVRDRFGLWMERTPYKTSHPQYLSMAWRFFKKAQEKGLLYKDYKSVAWCPHDETTLSDYEIKDTYKTLEDPSIYVKFPVKEKDKTTNYDEYIVIWTTTPWTLESNMAVAVKAEFDYSKVLVELNGNKEVLIVATNLIDKLIETFSKSTCIDTIKLIEILETMKGAELEGVGYNHIYANENKSQKEFAKSNHKHVHSVILADFVTLGEGEDIFEKLEKKGYKHSNKQEKETEEKEGTKTPEKSAKKPKAEDAVTLDVRSGPSAQKKPKAEGTGIVHIAPGHGFDDYEVGKKYNIPIYSPVGVNGCFTEGKYEGMYFKDVDEPAIEYLKSKKLLLSHTIKSHRYPCCWRCKTPIVYRAADQWWIKRSEVTPKIIKENKNVQWFPESAKKSFNNLMANAGDWAISRQRYWGIPLPIFEDEDGNYEVFGSKDELETRIGYKLDDIHRDDLKSIEIKNKESGKMMKAVPFIADVWFDSGCASFASHYEEGLNFDEIIEKYYPIKWITEGEDQIRGWFSSLFNVGHVVTGKAPYNQVLFYRYIMDKEGQKMSKSLGNGITGTQAIENWGTDATRYYLATKRAPEEQVNFDADEFSLVSGFFNTLENVTKFVNSYIGEYRDENIEDKLEENINIQTLDVEDKWILYRLNKAIESYVKHFEHFKLNEAVKSVEEFIVKDLSKTYLKLIKERTTVKDDNLILIFNEIMKKVLVLLSPVIPFKAEKLYQDMDFLNKKESIFFEQLSEVDKVIVKEVESKKIDSNFELVQNVIQAVLNSRETAKIGVRWPLPQIDIVSSDNLKDDLMIFESLIKKLLNVQSINYDLGDVEISYNVKPNFATLKKDFDNMQEVIKTINMNKTLISEDLKLGEVTGNYDGINLDYETHIIKDIVINGEFVSSDFTSGTVILHTHQSELLLEEGYLRELIRKIQSMRKDMKLDKKDLISLSFDGSDEYFTKIALNFESQICAKVGASGVLSNNVGDVEEFEIKGKKLVVSVVKQ